MVANGDMITDVPSFGEDQQSLESDGHDEDYMYLPAVRFTFIACYIFVFIVGIASNVAMMVVCLRQWREAIRNMAFPASNYQNLVSTAVTNTFVTNLAIADIILCVFSLTSTPYSYYSHEWPFGDFLCRFTPSTLIFAVCLISFTSTVMAVDRYIAICHPHNRECRLNVKSSLIAVIVVCSASLAACIPIFLSYHVTDEIIEVATNQQPEFVTISKCEEYFPSETFRRIFSSAILSVQFLIPAVIIAYCYTAIFVTLQRQKQFRQGHLKAASSPSSGDNNAPSQRRLWKTTTILMAMIAIFMACWMPINVLLLTADYYSETLTLWQTTNWFSLAYFSSHLLAMTSTISNPLLYGWLNERLRPEILKICCLRSSVKQQQTNKPTTNFHKNNEEFVLQHKANGENGLLLNKTSSNNDRIHHSNTDEEEFDELFDLTNSNSDHCHNNGYLNGTDKLDVNNLATMTSIYSIDRFDK